MVSAYLTLCVVDLTLIGLWLWVVAKWSGLRFPVPDILITAALCTAIPLVAALGTRVLAGWALGLIVLGLIATGVEQADPWPDLALMAAGTLVVWFVTYQVL